MRTETWNCQVCQPTRKKDLHSAMPLTPTPKKRNAALSSRLLHLLRSEILHHTCSIVTGWHSQLFLCCPTALFPSAKLHTTATSYTTPMKWQLTTVCGSFLILYPELQTATTEHMLLHHRCSWKPTVSYYPINAHVYTPYTTSAVVPSNAQNSTLVWAVYNTWR